MDLFEEISKIKEELPKRDNITGRFKSHKYNFYQWFSFVLIIVSFFLGIFLGNLLSTCQVSSFFYSDVCVVAEFNFSAMIVVWFLGGILSLFIFAIGQITELLTSIDEKLNKKQ